MANDSIWLYNPSFPLSILAAILYTFPMAIQFYQTVFHYRSWYFLPVLIGAMLEVGGYIARAYSTSHQDQIVGLPSSPSLSKMASTNHYRPKAPLRGTEQPHRPRTPLRRRRRLPPHFAPLRRRPAHTKYTNLLHPNGQTHAHLRALRYSLLSRPGVGVGDCVLRKLERVDGDNRHERADCGLGDAAGDICAFHGYCAEVSCFDEEA
jgi:hypothetical protein